MSDEMNEDMNAEAPEVLPEITEKPKPPVNGAEFPDPPPPGMYIVEVESIKVVPAGMNPSRFNKAPEDTFTFVFSVLEPKKYAGFKLMKGYVRMAINPGGGLFKPNLLYVISKAAMPDWDGQKLKTKELLGKKLQVSLVHKTGTKNPDRKFANITDYFPVEDIG